MDGQRKGVLGIVGMISVSATVIVVTLMLVLGSHREIAAWVILGTVVLMSWVWVACQINEAVLRHKRYHYRQETPLDQDEYSMHVQPGERVYRGYMGQPKRDAFHEWE